MKPVLHFALILLLSLFFAFIVYLIILYFLEIPLWGNRLIAAYLINYLLAVSIYAFLYRSRAKYSDSLGFLFMAGSFLKFAAFFIFFYPAYHADNNIETIEFATFFIPYTICLILETLGLIKILQN
ncbi:MAG: hypothetical protein U5K51_06725 [Flavobacteriaceae bacterium]|nr:hypothetical protein [Flavobacteriaceae bacterium]